MMDHDSMSSMMSGNDNGGISHSDMDMGDDHCSMNMLFTWDYKNVCVIFSWWHIKKFSHLICSFAAIMALAYGYEHLKYHIYKYHGDRGATTNTSNTPASSARRSTKFYNSCWYGLQVGYSFLLMLIFMSYNGWLMLAVVLGAVWGHYSCSPRTRSITLEESSLSCH